MNVKQFKYVLALAREGSFSKAADALEISQPSLSQYIKKVEKDVGQVLFDRTNGEVRITDAGRAYIDIGRQILELERQMQLRLLDIAENKEGSIVVGTAPYRAAAMMPTIAKEFQARYPGMHLVVREGTTADLIDDMEHGEYDLVLTLLPIDERLFDYEEIFEEELVLAVPKDYPPFETVMIPNRKYPAVDVTVLDHQKLIMLTDVQFMQRQLENLKMDYSLNITPAAVVKSIKAQFAMVREGVGMALVPDSIGRFHEEEVIFYSFAQPLPKRKVVVMWRKDRTLSDMTEALKKVILDIKW